MLTIIVLVKNEERHLPRFFDKLKGLKNYQVIVNDNGSEDKSKEICIDNKAIVVEKEWLGNQAIQFNWMLDNCKISSDWILRLDADEYLLPQLVDEINEIVNTNKPTDDAYYLKRRHYVEGKFIKQGMYPTLIVRFFKKGKARYNDTMLMDEHLEVNGSVGVLNYDFVDESLMNRVEWLDKHVKYAKREALMSFDKENLPKLKKYYYKLPIFIRPFVYFFFIYFFKLGFLNGRRGFYWFLFQVLFYRLIVDVYILSYKRIYLNVK